MLKWMAGENCSDCATNVGPPGQCDQCLRGWTGENCSECNTNFGPPEECDQCLRGWAGENCGDCATNFGPPGQCDACLQGWIGLECNACERFGFSTASNCTECIQNGYWTGKWIFDMTAYLTFEGPACTKLVPGMY